MQPRAPLSLAPCAPLPRLRQAHSISPFRSEKPHGRNLRVPRVLSDPEFAIGSRDPSRRKRNKYAKGRRVHGEPVTRKERKGEEEKTRLQREDEDEADVCTHNDIQIKYSQCRASFEHLQSILYSLRCTRCRESRRPGLRFFSIVSNRRCTEFVPRLSKIIFSAIIFHRKMSVF